MTSHIVVVGYGDGGRVVLRALQFDPRPSTTTVVDVNPARADLAKMDGADVVVGPGWRLETLWEAGAHEAEHVVVAVSDDAATLRVTSVVRSLNEEATVTAIVRSPEISELMQYLGADHVLTEDELVEWFMALPDDSVTSATADGPALVVVERAVQRDEVGRRLSECGPQVLAIIREGRRVWPEDPAADRLRPGDLLVVLGDIPAAG
ncbi:Trk K+ transport system NAD-binding subunit [Lentzea atacamensis]|uniref:Trk K+ transport system NAD-binding subunit n=1 Tax=Lentzea atacamensis TaxID=531938 RepID=A0ABX9EAY2_9PSEU|nr:NAD(P)-binding protein [Lentzea atacamensis]RAS67331.1 Trk K+ transport system NAD-binding subunit [Lentzea atacamensis]